MADWKNRIVGYDDVSTNELKANPRNWRKHNKRQEETLDEVMTNVGIVQNIVVNKRTGLIVDGHLRLELASKRKQPFVPVTYIDISEEEEALIMSTFDPVGALAQTDNKLLKELTDTMSSWTDNVGTMLNELLETTNVQMQENTAPMTPPPYVPITYEDQQPKQAVDKSTNLLGDPLSKTYKDETAKESDLLDKLYGKDEREDAAPPKKRKSYGYVARNNEIWCIDHAYLVLVSDRVVNIHDKTMIDPAWVPYEESKSPATFFGLLHKALKLWHEESPATDISFMPFIVATSMTGKGLAYQVVVREDFADCLMHVSEISNVFTECVRD